MVSKRPTTEPLKEVQFKMGTDSLFQTGFDFSDALDDDGVYSYRLTGLARSANAQQQGAEEQRYAIAPSFTWRPNDKTNFTFLSYFQNEPETGYYGWLPKEGTVSKLPNGSRLPTDFNEGADNNTYSRNEKMVGYSFDHEFNDTFTVRQNLRYAQNKVSQKSVYGYGMCSDPLYTKNQAALNASPCKNIPQSDWDHTLTRQYVDDNEKLQNFSVDTQLQSKFATGSLDHTLLTGVDYMRMRNDINSWFGWAGSVAPSDIYNLDRSDFDFGAHNGPGAPYRVLNKQEQTGLYAQDQMQWDKVLFTLGGRYDWAKQDSLNRVSGVLDSRDDREFTWRGGVNYLFDNGVTPYFSYSESFEPNSQVGESGNIFAPSKGKQYEAGVKYVPSDRPIVLTGAVYQLTKTNNLMADPNGSSWSVDGGEIRSRGVEIEAKAALSASVNVVGSYTYTDAEYTTDTTYKGNTPAQVPKHMASLWGDYTLYDGALSGLTLGTGVRYTSSSYGDPANSFKVGSYTLVDALVRYDLARVGMAGSNVALHVNNLFDREYVASCFNTYGCFWGAERQVVATATFRF
ncbi:ferrichrome porin FhuA [Citrobacter portucalensis]